MSSRSQFSILNSQFSTIYVGGGTPSLLTPEQLQGLLDHAAALWDCSMLREVTLEANPEDLTGNYIAGLAKTGFNRLSIGVQSFDDGLLRLMNRRHDAQRAREAVAAAQRAGFDNISIDLIYGIPGMTDAQWERSLDEAIGLGVQHISAYHLTIEPGTVFGKMFGENETNHPVSRSDGSQSRVGTNHPVSRSGCHPSAGGEFPTRPVTEEESERQFETLRRKLGEAGFEHYEISNFALPGRRAVHNSAYWSGEPYLGVGPSAHSFDGDRRREWVSADVEKYIAAFPTIPSACGCHPSFRKEGNFGDGDKGISPPSGRRSTLAKRGGGGRSIYDGETLSDRELRNERIMTSLRTAEGVKSEELRVKSDKTQKFLAEGLLVKNGGRIAIPPEKFLLSDYVIGELFET